jgi:hypothetical protein
MKFPVLAIFSLCFFACIDEYSDIIVLRPDGSAIFTASVYPCEPDSISLGDIKKDYDSVWFEKRDSLYSLNFKLSFENLFDEKVENDLIGHVSLKKIDSLSNGYSFERIINPSTGDEDGEVHPEEIISSFALEQIIAKSDSIYWEFFLVLPPGAKLISSNSDSLRWKLLANEAVSKRISMKADFTLPAEKNIFSAYFFAIAAGCFIMLLAVVLLMRKLKNLSLALRELKSLQSQRELESEPAQDAPR